MLIILDFVMHFSKTFFWPAWSGSEDSKMWIVFMVGEREHFFVSKLEEESTNIFCLYGFYKHWVVWKFPILDKYLKVISKPTNYETNITSYYNLWLKSQIFNFRWQFYALNTSHFTSINQYWSFCILPC